MSQPFVYHDNTETFESFVRPVIVPVFRPPPPRVIPPLPEPEQDKAVITGASGEVITLTKSEQGSWSNSRPTEVKRTVTTQRIYQKKPDGTVNKENYVDVDATTKMTMSEGTETKTYYYAPPTEAPNIETINVNTEIKNPNWSEGGGGAAP